MATFFISYNKNDLEWARWIAWTLDDAGHTTTFQDRDFRPGQNFAHEMHKALETSDAVIAVLSENYLEAEHTYPEWLSAFADDPKGAKRKLIPVRVSRVKLTGLLKTINYIDVVGLPEGQAVRKLREGVAAEAVVSGKPDFPGTAAAKTDRPVVPAEPKPAALAATATDQPLPTPVEPKPEFPGPHRSVSDAALIWAIVAGIGLLLGTLLWKGDQLHTASGCLITVTVHVLLGLLSAYMLFRVLHSTGVMSGSAIGAKFEFGGPAAVAIFFMLVGANSCRTGTFGVQFSLVDIKNPDVRLPVDGQIEFTLMTRYFADIRDGYGVATGVPHEDLGKTDVVITDRLQDDYEAVDRKITLDPEHPIVVRVRKKITNKPQPPITDTSATNRTPNIPGTTVTSTTTSKREMTKDLERLDVLLAKGSLTDDEETEIDTIVLCLDQAQSRIGAKKWDDISARLEGRLPGTLDTLRKSNSQVTPCY